MNLARPTSQTHHAGGRVGRRYGGRFRCKSLYLSALQASTMRSLPTSGMNRGRDEDKDVRQARLHGSWWQVQHLEMGRDDAGEDLLLFLYC